jgi:hypothetical protein
MTQDNLNEASSNASVPIGEWMNRLELRMAYCGLDHGGHVVPIHERKEVIHQLRYVLLRRRDVIRAAWGIASTDPVLFSAKAARAKPLVSFVGQQCGMKSQNVVHFERPGPSAELDCLLHGSNIPQHGLCVDVIRVRGKGSLCEAFVR